MVEAGAVPRLVRIIGSSPSDDQVRARVRSQTVIVLTCVILSAQHGAVAAAVPDQSRR